MVVVFCVKVMKVRIDKLTCPRRGSWKIEIEMVVYDWITKPMD